MANETQRNKEPNIIPGMDIAIRWNSTYDLLFDALRIPISLTSLSIEMVRQKKNSNYAAIEDSDWETITKITSFFEVFKQGMKSRLINKIFLNSF